MVNTSLADSANTRRLIDRAVAGDDASFAALMQRYLPDVRQSVTAADAAGAECPAGSLRYRPGNAAGGI